jgi:hypothetical protein
MKNIFIVASILFAFCAADASAASVVAMVNGNPITDSDITARVALMALQGQNYTDNRRRALSNIIDDYVKLKYAEGFKISPTDSDIKKEISEMSKRGLNLSAMSETTREMMKSAIRANIAWQIIIARTIVPTISVTKEEIASETADLERAKGLPIDITFIRLTGIPTDATAKLTSPNNCDDAMKIAEALGGVPQKITAPQYELTPEIRERLSGLPLLKLSPRSDNSVLLICSKKKTKEYAKLDNMLEQNAIYKKAMFMGDNQLKQLRRKAVVVINDDNYKL